jgi:hypothetical protein
MGEKFLASRLGEWEALTGLGKAADQFNKDKGRVIDEQPVEPIAVQKEKFSQAKRLADFTGFRFYSMGPLYVHVGIPFDIMGGFGQATGFKGPRLLLTFDHDVLTPLDRWGNRLEGIPAENYVVLQQFMLTQSVTRIDADEYWAFDYKEVLIPDPLGIDRKEVNIDDPHPHAIVGVFLPSGNKYRLDTAGPAGAGILLAKRLPKASAVHEGTAILGRQLPSIPGEHTA